MSDDNKTADSNSGGTQDAGTAAKNIIVGEWMQRSSGDGDKDPLMCGEKGWHIGLFDACGNGGGLRCCQRWFCGSCMYGRAIAVGLDQNCCLCCFFMGYYCGWCAFVCCRGKLREKYGITGGNFCCDLVKCLFCPPCLLQQFIQEVNFRNNIHIGPFGDPEGTWNCKIDCGNDIPDAKIGTELQTGSSMTR